MARLFGTDGVRGVANTELTCELAYRLGQAAAVFLGKNIVVGKDTRLSGDMLESALAAGIMSVDRAFGGDYPYACGCAARARAARRRRCGDFRFA